MELTYLKLIIFVFSVKMFQNKNELITFVSTKDFH